MIDPYGDAALEADALRSFKRMSIIVLVTVVLLTAFVNLIDYLSTEAILYLFD